jgi:hypothetical protein
MVVEKASSSKGQRPVGFVVVDSVHLDVHCSRVGTHAAASVCHVTRSKIFTI